MPPRATKKQKKDEGGPAPDVPPAIPEGEVLEVTPAQPASNGSAPVPAIGALVVRPRWRRFSNCCLYWIVTLAQCAMLREFANEPISQHDRTHRGHLKFSADARSAAQAGGQGFVFGFRVPRDYFITKGWGDTSDVRPCTAHS
jgi:hypothetical protein